jgi:hypothetical protein
MRHAARIEHDPLVKVSAVDPRDQTWELSADRFRVYFWSSPRHPESWVSDEWEVESSDVREVVAWADSHRSARGDYVLYAVAPFDGLGLIKLAGTDPTEAGDEGWSTPVVLHVDDPEDGG